MSSPSPDSQMSEDIEKKEHDVSLSSTAVDMDPDMSAPVNGSRHIALVDWDGPDDKGNPKTWSIKKKIFHTAIPALYGFSVALGTSVYSPGITQLAVDFHCSEEVAILGLSLYAVGLAFGPMVGAPISEALGRKGVYLYTMPIYLLFVMGSGLAQNIGQFLVLRFLAGLFGSPSLAIGAGTIADVWEMEHGGGLATVLIVQTFFLGPSLGPLIGGFAFQQRGTWRWLMWVSLLISGPIYAMVLLSSETSKVQLLRRRAKARGLPGPPKPPMKVALRTLFVITLFRPIKMLLTEPIVILISVYNAFAFAVLFAFFAAYPYVFTGVYGFQSEQVGLAFLGILIGTLLALVTFVIIDKTIYQKVKAKCPPGTIPPPEQRLYSSMLGCFGMPIGLFWFAWSAKPEVHWISPIIAGVPFGWGMCSLFVSGMTYLVDTYQALYSASTIAANGLLRYGMGAAFPLFTLQMYEKLGIGWATSLLGFISVAMMPIPWVLWTWGPALRAKSQFKPERLIHR